MSSINKRIGEVRRHFNMSQDEFAKKIFVSKGFISSIETESRRVTGRICKLVSTIFGVSEEWLKTGEGPMLSTGNPDFEIEEILSLYKQLKPFFKKYFLRQLRELIEYEKEEAPKTSP